jgi:branched-chain amino acid transport system ATP-binding protein
MPDPLLSVERLEAGYGSVTVLHDISFRMSSGEVAALVGANGAGKTTTLRCLSGLLSSNKGVIRFRGEPISRTAPHRIVEMGLVQVPEGRLLFPAMTVKENLLLGAFLSKSRNAIATDLEKVLHLFPALREKLTSRAGSLSGGRALMARPKLLVLDEPSLGLAPLVVQDIFRIIGQLAESGLAILLVEQNISNALNLAHQGWVLENGVIALEGTGRALLADPRVQSAYLGVH